MDKVKVSVGIPAYNEEANISNLIDKLLEQTESTFELFEIIVISDLSTDKTDEIVKSYNNEKIKLFRNQERLGQALGQNKILDLYQGEILVLLNADILPKNNVFIQEIIKPIQEKSDVGLVGAKVEPLPPTNFFEKILYSSNIMKQDIYENLLEKENVYLCHGRARAFSRELTNNFRWKPYVGEDSYSYFSCITLKLKFKFASNAVVLYQLPSTFKDHIKQSARFMNSISSREENFDRLIVSAAYKVPTSVKLSSLYKHIFKSKGKLVLYIIIYLYIKLFANKEQFNTVKWDTSKSSKNLKQI
jgi:glycosyltransferase involved in cell wall biosynthesis